MLPTEISPSQYYLLTVAVILFGAVIGSFLNVCIYRIPKNMSVASPKRSFCPSCNADIKWHDNIPVVSWLLLKGKCRSCHKPISGRYASVELLTAALFWAAWLMVPVSALPSAFVLISLMVVASFIDIDHLMIPESLTIGGMCAGVALSTAFPGIAGAVGHLGSLKQSLLGALVGGGVTWAMVDLGKLLFGDATRKLPVPMTFSLSKGDDGKPVFVLGKDVEDWEDIFFRFTDKVRLICPTVTVGDTTFADAVVKVHYKKTVINDIVIKHSDLESITGTFTKITVPQEAMGFGDVKFMAAIGAFIGWQGSLFAIFGSAMFGAVLGLAMRGIATAMRGPRVEKLPFGPLLAAGAVLWAFFDHEIAQWYLLNFWE